MYDDCFHGCPRCAHLISIQNLTCGFGILNTVQFKLLWFVLKTKMNI